MRRKKQRKQGEAKRPDASKLKVGIAVARFNGDITAALLLAARRECIASRVKESNIHVVHVAGSFELPFATAHLLRKKKVHAVVALGCIIKGETDHDEYIAEATFQTLQDMMRDLKKPIGLGILTVNNVSQAKKRISYGSAAAAAALEAALL